MHPHIPSPCPPPANALWVFQRVIALTFANFHQSSGALVYMDDVIVYSANFEAHLRLLGDTVLEHSKQLG